MDPAKASALDDVHPQRTKTARRLRRQQHWFVIAAVLIAVFVLYVLGQASLASLQSVTQIVIFVGAAVLSYDRFFRGRTSVPRAELSLAVQVKKANDRHLHVIDLRFKNIGTMTIWGPTPCLARRILTSASESAETAPGECKVPLYASHKEANSVADSGETVMYCAACEVPATALAVHYEAAVQDESGKWWWYATTIVLNNAIDG